MLDGGPVDRVLRLASAGVRAIYRAARRVAVVARHLGRSARHWLDNRL